MFQGHGRKEKVWTGNLGGEKQGRYSTTCKRGWSLHRLSLAPLLAGIPKAMDKSSAMLPERCSVSWQRLLVRPSRCVWLALRAPRTWSEGALLRHNVQRELCAPCSPSGVHLAKTGPGAFHAVSSWVWVSYTLRTGVHSQALANAYPDLHFFQALALNQGRNLPSKK